MIEMEKIWQQLLIDYADDRSSFQIEREKKDGIWDGQVKYFDENKIVENYLNKIKRISWIAGYSEKLFKFSPGGN